MSRLSKKPSKTSHPTSISHNELLIEDQHEVGIDRIRNSNKTGEKEKSKNLSMKKNETPQKSPIVSEVNESSGQIYDIEEVKGNRNIFEIELHPIWYSNAMTFYNSYVTVTAAKSPEKYSLLMDFKSEFSLSDLDSVDTNLRAGSGSNLHGISGSGPNIDSPNTFSKKFNEMSLHTLHNLNNRNHSIDLREMSDNTGRVINTHLSNNSNFSLNDPTLVPPKPSLPVATDSLLNSTRSDLFSSSFVLLSPKGRAAAAIRDVDYVMEELGVDMDVVDTFGVDIGVDYDTVGVGTSNPDIPSILKPALYPNNNIILSNSTNTSTLKQSLPNLPSKPPLMPIVCPSSPNLDRHSLKLDRNSVNSLKNSVNSIKSPKNLKDTDEVSLKCSNTTHITHKITHNKGSRNSENEISEASRINSTTTATSKCTSISRCTSMSSSMDDSVYFSDVVSRNMKGVWNSKEDRGKEGPRGKTGSKTEGCGRGEGGLKGDLYSTVDSVADESLDMVTGDKYEEEERKSNSTHAPSTISLPPSTIPPTSSTPISSPTSRVLDQQTSSEKTFFEKNYYEQTYPTNTYSSYPHGTFPSHMLSPSIFQSDFEPDSRTQIPDSFQQPTLNHHSLSHRTHDGGTHDRNTDDFMNVHDRNSQAFMNSSMVNMNPNTGHSSTSHLNSGNVHNNIHTNAHTNVHVKGNTYHFMNIPGGFNSSSSMAPTITPSMNTPVSSMTPSLTSNSLNTSVNFNTSNFNTSSHMSQMSHMNNNMNSGSFFNSSNLASINPHNSNNIAVNSPVPSTISSATPIPTPAPTPFLLPTPTLTQASTTSSTFSLFPLPLSELSSLSYNGYNGYNGFSQVRDGGQSDSQSMFAQHSQSFLAKPPHDPVETISEVSLGNPVGSSNTQSMFSTPPYTHSHSHSHAHSQTLSQNSGLLNSGLLSHPGGLSYTQSHSHFNSHTHTTELADIDSNNSNHSLNLYPLSRTQPLGQHDNRAIHPNNAYSNPHQHQHQLQHQHQHHPFQHQYQDQQKHQYQDQQSQDRFLQNEIQNLPQLSYLQQNTYSHPYQHQQHLFQHQSDYQSRDQNMVLSQSKLLPSSSEQPEHSHSFKLPQSLEHLQYDFHSFQEPYEQLHHNQQLNQQLNEELEQEQQKEESYKEASHTSHDTSHLAYFDHSHPQHISDGAHTQHTSDGASYCSGSELSHLTPTPVLTSAVPSSSSTPIVKPNVSGKPNPVKPNHTTLNTSVPKKPNPQSVSVTTPSSTTSSKKPHPSSHRLTCSYDDIALFVATATGDDVIRRMLSLEQSIEKKKQAHAREKTLLLDALSRYKTKINMLQGQIDKFNVDMCDGLDINTTGTTGTGNVPPSNPMTKNNGDSQNHKHIDSQNHKHLHKGGLPSTNNKKSNPRTDHRTDHRGDLRDMRDVNDKTVSGGPSGGGGKHHSGGGNKSNTTVANKHTANKGVKGNI